MAALIEAIEVSFMGNPLMSIALTREVEDAKIELEQNRVITNAERARRAAHPPTRWERFLSWCSSIVETIRLFFYDLFRDNQND